MKTVSFFWLLFPGVAVYCFSQPEVPQQQVRRSNAGAQSRLSFLLSNESRLLLKNRRRRLQQQQQQQKSNSATCLSATTNVGEDDSDEALFASVSSTNANGAETATTQQSETEESSTTNDVPRVRNMFHDYDKPIGFSSTDVAVLFLGLVSNGCATFIGC